MSFFKNLTKELEGLMSDDKKTKKPEKDGDDTKQRGKANALCSSFRSFVDDDAIGLLIVQTRDISLNLSVLCSRFRATGQPPAV